MTNPSRLNSSIAQSIHHLDGAVRHDISSEDHVDRGQLQSLIILFKQRPVLVSRMRWVAVLLIAMLLVSAGCDNPEPKVEAVPISPNSFGTSSKTPRFVYVATNSATSGIAMYDVNASTGALTSLGTKTGLTPYWLAVDPAGQYLYAATSGNIYGYTINASTGALTLINSWAGGASGTSSIAVDHTGSYAFESTSGSFNLLSYQILGGGSLNSLSNYFPSGNQIVTTSPTGSYLILPDSTGIHSYSISGAGALTSIGSQTISGVATQAVFDPTGIYVYTATTVGNIDAFSYSNGNLSVLGTATGSSTSTGLAVDGSGKFLYVANTGGSSISYFPLASGVPSGTANTSTPGYSPRFLASEPTGNFVYATASFSVNGYLMGFQINASTGALTQLFTPISLGSGSPSGLVVVSY
jgi:6-phosphogluconolactonase (cycloisomerase 2 family)